MAGRVFRTRYRVLNAIGWSNYSPITYIRAAQVPVAPGKPTFVEASGTSIKLTLTRSTDNGGSNIIRHDLFVDDGNLGAFSNVTTYDGSSIIVTISSGIVAGKFYRFSYKAVNDVGSSESSGMITVGFAALPP
jgi:hypothetical protein